MMNIANTSSASWPRGSSASTWCLIVALFATSPSGVFAQSGAANTNPNSLVPPNFGELTAKWWKWAIEAPPASNPVFGDTTGVNCPVGQSGNVWFLAGGIPGSGPITRFCTIPAGKILLIPVSNNVYLPFKTDPIRNAVFSRMSATDTAVNLEADIDGTKVLNLSDYRIQAKAFAILLPADNLFGLAAGPYAPCAADGTYLPIVLPAGMHTIHVHGEYADGSFEDATAILTVL